MAKYWYQLESAEDAAQSALEVAHALESGLFQQQRELDRNAMTSYESDAFGSGDSVTVTNTIQQAVDTFCNDVVHQRVKVQFLTDGGDYELRERAQNVSRAIEAIWEEAGLFALEGLAFCRDGFVLPSGGCLRVSADYEQAALRIERVRGSRIFVDPRDGRMRKPRQLVYVEDYPLELLQARFPEHAASLEDAEKADISSQDQEESVLDAWGPSNRVKVYEVWHLPSTDVDETDKSAWGWEGEPDHDGKHMTLACTGGKPLVLDNEAWPLAVFPFVRFIPFPRMRGVTGYTLVQRLRATQSKIDFIHDRVGSILNLHSRMMLYVNRKANLQASSVLTNDWTRAVEGDLPASEAITHITPTTVPPELHQYLQQLVEWSEKFTGKTELAMRGVKPEGVNSGIGLRTLLERDSVRHSDIFRAWEQSFVDLATLQIGMWGALSIRSPGFSLTFGDDQALRKMKWSEVGMDRNKFRWRAWPTNLFGSTPAAKLEGILDIFKTGVLPAEQLVGVLVSQFPDIKALFGDQNSVTANIELKLADVVRTKAVTPQNAPHGALSLPLARKLGEYKMNALEAGGASQDAVEAMSQWLELLSQVEDMASSKGVPTTEAVPAAPAPAQQGML